MGTIATKSKKAARIESALLNKLALMGQKTFARAMGVPEYQVSRWKNGFFSQVSMMLAVLEYGIEDDEMAELTKRLANYLTKRRKKYQEKEEIRHPDSPEGLVVAAANNRAFAERLVGVYRLAKAGVKHGRR
ncbi:CII family transcriptional regulator [Escherichia coli]